MIRAPGQRPVARQRGSAAEDALVASGTRSVNNPYRDYSDALTASQGRTMPRELCMSLSRVAYYPVAPPADPVAVRTVTVSAGQAGNQSTSTAAIPDYAEPGQRR